MKKILAIFAIVTIAGIGTGHVHAQEPPSSNQDVILSDLGYVAGFLSFPAAGIYYATTGFAKKFARSLAGEKTQIDYTRIGKTALLGVIVGVIAFVYVIYNGETIHVVTLHQFLTQAAINLTAILTIDRLVLGGYAKPKPESTDATKTGKSTRFLSNFFLIF